MKLKVEVTKRPANGAVYLQSNTHLFSFHDPSKQSGLKDEPQKLDIQLKK